MFQLAVEEFFIEGGEARNPGRETRSIDGR
jgi:hypothetical protein